MTTSPTIGILAGMGPRSTGPFLDLVVTACQELYGARHDIDFPTMLICSQPAPFYEDRPVDHAALEAATLDGLHTLVRGGADFLGIACNTVHMYFETLREQAGRPLLSIVDLAVSSLPGPSRRVALVAARATAESLLYQRALRAAGHQPVELDLQDHVDGMLSAVRETTDPEAFRAQWAPIMARAEALQADAVLVACLDLSGIVRHAEPRVRIVDAAEALARGLVMEWMRRGGTAGGRDGGK